MILTGLTDAKVQDINGYAYVLVYTGYKLVAPPPTDDNYPQRWI